MIVKIIEAAAKVKRLVVLIPSQRVEVRSSTTLTLLRGKFENKSSEGV